MPHSRTALPILARRRPQLPLGTLALVVVLGCGDGGWPSPAPLSDEQLAREHAEWRTSRRDGLVEVPAGVVLWNGLFELPQGDTRFGSDTALPIVLPAGDAPPFAGTLRRAGQDIVLEPAPGAPLSLREGAPITAPTPLASDRTDKATVLKLGSLGMRIHGEPGTDRLWLRTWDEDSPLRETFQLPEAYPVDGDWRVSARLERYDEPRGLRFADVTGGTIEYETPGELVFRIRGEEHSLIAVDDGGRSGFLMIMWDSTAAIDTYQGGRYMRVPYPEEEGWTVIDFNRAYNPPCVFTVYSVCALPPRDNWLPFAVTAGEKRPEKPAREHPLG